MSFLRCDVLDDHLNRIIDANLYFVKHNFSKSSKKFLERKSMMDAVEYVREVCKQRGIAVSRMERECGFANGSLRSIKTGRFTDTRNF